MLLVSRMVLFDGWSSLVLWNSVVIWVLLGIFSLCRVVLMYYFFLFRW